MITIMIKRLNGNDDNEETSSRVNSPIASPPHGGREREREGQTHTHTHTHTHTERERERERERKRVGEWYS